MISKCSFLVLVLNVFVFCDSGFVDTLNKCEASDQECFKKLLQKVLLDVAADGAPDINLPSVDPIFLNNITVKALDVIEITLIEGQAKGIKKCAIDKFEVKLEDQRVILDLTCDILVKGKYKLFSDSPVIKNFINGDTVHGEGNGKIKIEKLKLKLDFLFFIEERNGDLYIKSKIDNAKYDFDIKGKMIFAADKIYVGEVESSKAVTELMNANWKFIVGSFGKPFMDKAMQYVFNFLEKFFDGVPAKYYITNDLSAYVAN